MLTIADIIIIIAICYLIFLLIYLTCFAIKVTKGEEYSNKERITDEIYPKPTLSKKSALVTEEILKEESKKDKLKVGD